ANEIAPAWRERWDSLKLFTPRLYDALPGMPFPGDPDGYPGRDEVVAYLRSYVAEFQLPVRLDSPVRALRRDGEGRFEIQLDHETLTADQVVVATGGSRIRVCLISRAISAPMSRRCTAPPIGRRLTCPKARSP